MKIRYVLVPLVLAALIFIGYVLHYLGFFKPVLISEAAAGPFHLLYKEHIGPYHKIAPVIEEVERWVKEQPKEEHLDCAKSFGYYFDNPDIIEEARLRSWGGCLIGAEAHLPATLPEGFKFQDLPAQKYVTAIFEGSPAIGPQKVYARVYKYIEVQRLHMMGPVLEEYEVHSQTAMTTRYFFAVQ